MAVANAITVVIIPAIIIGIIIGFIEMLFVHSDEIGMGWFGHGLHAFPFAILFTFVSMNASWAVSLIPGLKDNIWIDLGVIAVISILAMLKISAAAAIAGRVGERFYHTLMIGGIIFLVGILSKFIVPAIRAILPAVFRF